MTYTTGEMARLCGVTVRTVQYYDARGLLHPSALSEGGRRLYSQADLQQMRLICALRQLGVPVDKIREMLREENAGNVLRTLLEEQKQALETEIRQRQSQYDTLNQIVRELGAGRGLPAERVPDLTHRASNRKKLHRLYGKMLALGIAMDLVEIGTILLWIFRGIWWPFAVGMAVVIFWGVTLTRIYYRNTAYICPECHEIFRPRLRAFLFAYHAPRTRRLTCPACGQRSFCTETWGGEPHAGRESG